MALSLACLTRPALRVSAGEAEATAERRLRELEGLLEEACSERDQYREHADSGSEALAEKLRSMEVREGRRMRHNTVGCIKTNTHATKNI